MSQQFLILLNCFLFSNVESSPSQALEVSGSESLKSDKYYLTSALADGVLQQVEVTSNCSLYHKQIYYLCLPLLDCVVCSPLAEQRSSSFSLCSGLSQSHYEEVFLSNLHGVFPWTLGHGEPQEGARGCQYF